MGGLQQQQQEGDGQAAAAEAEGGRDGQQGRDWLLFAMLPLDRSPFWRIQILRRRLNFFPRSF